MPIDNGGSNDDEPQNPPSGTQCRDGSGVCQSITQPCGSTYVRGLCDGDYTIKCCRSPVSSSDDDQSGIVQSGPRCRFNSHTGSCIDATTCGRGGGQAFSSRRGAMGCEALAGNIQCCVAGSSLLVDETGDVAVGTPDDSLPPEDDGVPAGAIAGIVIGAVFLIALVAVGVCFAVRATSGGSSAASGGDLVFVNSVYAPTAATTSTTSIGVQPSSLSSSSAMTSQPSAPYMTVDVSGSGTMASVRNAQFDSMRSARVDGVASSGSGHYTCAQCNNKYDYAEDLAAHVSLRHANK